ncbi:hypothetical protein BMEII0877 [Brucella melitensis bv. 1 str. 16M]|uniref:Uncharacterized protein n=2 Tax=Brucella melitensis TaxID=29459 RepID=C0RKU0_BRUMB|nr:hypothetical protein BMEII0877 [Brucella melitensis bv. 1 str. 16M]ACO02223.1 Hypothetical protein, conserved [Brucella melitensis ATCC 23457]EEW87230.1 predicted protein [Brucella melitensis bv. 1 str. 16M]EEX84336.1 predicted protein [Brucella abortus bv. 3 str. Tulya]EEZ10086.1 predicted protein [Brucella melitensis bv. 3 str. Ether]
MSYNGKCDGTLAVEEPCAGGGLVSPLYKCLPAPVAGQVVCVRLRGVFFGKAVVDVTYPDHVVMFLFSESVQNA